MEPSIVEFSEAILAKYPHCYSKDIPMVKTTKTEELLGTIRNQPYQKVVRVKYQGEPVVFITDPKIGALFGNLYREDEADPKNPLKIKTNCITRYFLGLDSFITCKASESRCLRRIFGTFMNSLSEKRMLKFCRKTLMQETVHWKQSPGKETLIGKICKLIPSFMKRQEGTPSPLDASLKNKSFTVIDLQKEVPTLVAKIGIEGILGFKKESNQIVSDAMMTLSKQGNWISQGFASYQLYSTIADEVKSQLDSGAVHPFLASLRDYAYDKLGLKSEQRFTNEVIQLIVHNYFIALFGFQDMISDLVKHIFYEVASDEALQKEFQSKADLVHDLLSKGKIEEGLRKVRELFDPLIIEGFRLYSPGGVSRTAGKDFVIKDPIKDFATDDAGFQATGVKEGDRIEYVAALASRLSTALESPEKFDPNRWSDAEAAHKANDALHHFGTTKHHCLGAKFSWELARIFFVELLGSYDFKAISKKPIELHMAPILNSFDPLLVQVSERDIAEKASEEPNSPDV